MINLQSFNDLIESNFFSMFCLICWNERLARRSIDWLGKVRSRDNVKTRCVWIIAFRWFQNDKDMKIKNVSFMTSFNEICCKRWCDERFVWIQRVLFFARFKRMFVWNKIFLIIDKDVYKYVNNFVAFLFFAYDEDSSKF